MSLLKLSTFQCGRCYQSNFTGKKTGLEGKQLGQGHITTLFHHFKMHIFLHLNISEIEIWLTTDDILRSLEPGGSWDTFAIACVHVNI